VTSQSVDYIHTARCLPEGHRFRLRYGVSGPCVNLGPEGKWTVRCPECNTDGWKVSTMHRECITGYEVGPGVRVLAEPLESKAAKSRRAARPDGLQTRKATRKGARIPEKEFVELIRNRFGDAAVQEYQAQVWN